MGETPPERAAPAQEATHLAAGAGATLAYLRIFSPFIKFRKHITTFHLSALIPKDHISLHITRFLSPENFDKTWQE